MRQTLSIFGMIVVFLALMDMSVAGALSVAEKQERLTSLVGYFNYGRSVPGKLAQWEANPAMARNLYDVGWRKAGVARSAARFTEEPVDIGPVVRGYGMSFVNNILQQAVDVDQSLKIDLHSGPGAPPNYTYALFEDDRENRRDGDIAVLGILSSALPAMEALSNQTWVFEQPAPFTYPIYEIDGPDLRRIDPVIESAAAHRAMAQDPALAEDWKDQLINYDSFYGPKTFGAVWADRSPFLRLVRRSLAKGAVEMAKQKSLDDGLYAEILPRIVISFTQTAREDGQVPVVMLIQSRDLSDPDLLSLLSPVLNAQEIPVLATVNYANPRDPAMFLGDGHYQPLIDRRFAEVFLALIEGFR
jgi:Na+-transporting methylmalonyl-CoA/oxaloacetate decarboxylase gamma subunit